eukprot:scaffold36274_cov125-Isochrysis_galbana.AAC.3
MERRGAQGRASAREKPRCAGWLRLILAFLRELAVYERPVADVPPSEPRSRPVQGPNQPAAPGLPRRPSTVLQSI